MADLTSLTSLNNYLWFSVVYLIVILVYSLYILWLNRKQSKVLDEIKKTNEILAKILEVRK